MILDFSRTKCSSWDHDAGVFDSRKFARFEIKKKQIIRRQIVSMMMKYSLVLAFVGRQPALDLCVSNTIEHRTISEMN